MSFVKQFVTVLFAAALLLSSAPRAYGQATTGELTGRVTDAASAVIPGVTVTLRSPDTGLVRTAVTNDTGEYLFLLIPPGRYTVAAELAGFKKVERPDVLINVGTRQTLSLQLEVGALSEVLVVSGATPLIETTRSDLGGVITPTEITNLPLLNRTFANLSVIMPEARPAGNFDPTKTRTGNVAMNGGDGRQLDVNVDGGDNKDNVVGSLIQNFAYESIQEFQVLQHRWTAESGRAVGGVVNVITKSGTNNLRGSLFGTYRDQDLAAKDFFQERGGAKQTFERWEYGGSAGGPIKRDKLFFFGALERFDEPKGETPVRPDALTQLSLVPGANPVTAIPTPYDDTLLTAKVDHRLASNQTMFYRFSLQRNSSDNDQVANPALTDLSGGSTNVNDIYDFVANHTLNVGSDRLNQFSFHFQDFQNEILGVSEDPIQIFAGNFRTGPAPNTPQATTSRKFQFRNDFTWQRENHCAEGRRELHPHQAGRLFLLRRVRLSADVVRRPADDRHQHGAVSAGLLHARRHPADRLLRRRSDPRPDVPSGRALRAGRLAGEPAADAEPRPALGRQRRAAVRSDEQPHDQPAAAARRSAGPGDHRRRRPPVADHAELEGVPAAPRVRLRPGRRRPFGHPRRLRPVLRPDLPEPDAVLVHAEHAGDLLADHEPHELGRRRRPGGRPSGTASIRCPPPPPFDFSQLPAGAFGRINDPDMSDPYVHKFSIGYQRTFAGNWTASTDYVHTRGDDEGRVQVINPQIRSVCDPAFPGSSPSDARCVAGASTRYFDAAFARAGLGAGRLGQINMIGTTNESKFDSWTTTVRGRTGRALLSLSYVLANSRAWGGQPTASYSGNGIAITPEDQFLDGEWGPTRMDERHRIVASGVIDIPYGFQLSPIVQFASARPYTPILGFDVNGDGQTNIVDRLCEGVSLQSVFAVRGDLTAIRALNPNGCRRTSANSQRVGFVVNADGTLEERSGNFFNADLRVTKAFNVGGRTIKVYADLFNVFNTENLSFTLRPEQSAANVASSFMQPVSLYGPGFGPPVGRPFTASFGARFDF